MENTNHTKNDYSGLNPQQLEAVKHIDGPLLILAGAGSGKTRVITHRISYLIEEYGAAPWNILAITFTNKAASEMKERVENLLDETAMDTWVGTFHRLCVYLLRPNVSYIDYDKNFIIYDTDDQKSLMKEVIKLLDLDPKKYKEKSILNAISSAKNELITPERFLENAGNNYGQQIIAKAYAEYQKRLHNNNAFDFDDLIMKTVELLKNNPNVLEKYQNRFKYIMVDEYQDTNTAQFELVRLLAGSTHNLCVVGDDDQSIYKFRGANIYNILNFEKHYPEAKVIRLEQNYRSTGNILSAANEVILHNQGRKSKKLWTTQEDGSPILYTQYETGFEEAQGIVDSIVNEMSEEGRSYEDFAILYRTNAQSRMLEEKLVLQGIPYRLVGGINFYQRREIKDILAYLRTINHGSDDLSVKRILNVPKRGIGLASIDKIEKHAAQKGISFYEALMEAAYIPGLNRAVDKIQSFVSRIEIIKDHLKDPDYSLTDLYDEIMEAVAYPEYIRDESEDELKAQERLDNMEELRNRMAAFEQDAEELATLEDFLADISLVADIDSLDESVSQVCLMTLHSAKGLEFPCVFICGMETGIFPSYLSMDDPEEVEEERRLCYVGITRAKKKLYLSCARSRMVRGETQFNKPSIFIQEIPRYLLKSSVSPSYSRGFGSFANTNSYGNSNSYGDSDSYGTSGGYKNPGKPENSGSSKSQGSTGGGIKSLDNNPLISKGFSGLPGKKTFDFSLKNSSYSAKAPETKPFARLDYGVGDRVSHVKFGEGTVLSITPGTKDNIVEVDFENAGVKKMQAGFANLKKL